MNVGYHLSKVGLFVAAIASIGWGQSVQAAAFSQAEINQDKLIAIAVPRAGHYYSLLILEQLSAQKKCWRETGTNPTRVEPLLLNFDFTNICSRSTDSNGYSVRMAGKDQGLDYRLSVQKEDNEVVLLGIPRSGGSKIEIAHTNGIGTGFLKLTLNPGWRFTKRAYSGKKLGHIYLTRDTIAPPVAVKPKSLEARTIDGSDSTSEPAKVAQNNSEETSSEPVKESKSPQSKSKGSILFRSSKSKTWSLSSSSKASSSKTSTSKSSPAVTESDRPQVARSSQENAAGLTYRLMVVTADAKQQTKLQAQIPGAFRTRHKGRSVMQVGIFSDKEKAEAVKQQLKRQGFKVLLVSDRRQAATLPPPTAPVLYSSGSVLPVPNQRIPIGRSRSKLLPPPPDTAVAIAPRYRVLVLASRERQSQIRTLVPGAFRSTYRGQSAIQVGSYPDPNEATPVMELIKTHGFDPILERTP